MALRCVFVLIRVNSPRTNRQADPTTKYMKAKAKF